MTNNKKNILVIEDNAEIGSYIKQGLEYFYPAAYNIRCINCRKNFFKMLEKSYFIPNVILLDVSTPAMNRWEVLDFLKHNLRWKFIPIIFLDGKGDKLANNFGNFFGDEFIEKPIEIKNIKEKIEYVLRN